MDLAAIIRNVPDFPKAGVQFKDITTLLQHPAAFKEIIDGWKGRYEPQDIDAIVGVDARGLIFGAPLAYAMEKPFIPIRKKGKLPYQTLSCTYELEYGQDTLEVHRDALKPGDRVVVVDDLLATGGTIHATCTLVQQLGAEVVEVAFVVELPPLGGRARLADYPVHSLVQFMVD